jgi:hypothetical protein
VPQPTTLPRACRMVGWSVDNKLERILICDLTEILSRNFIRKDEKNYDNINLTEDKKGPTFWDVTPRIRMEANRNFGRTYQFTWTTRSFMPEDRNLHNHRCQNPKFYSVRVGSFLAKLETRISQIQA